MAKVLYSLKIAIAVFFGVVLPVKSEIILKSLFPNQVVEEKHDIKENISIPSSSSVSTEDINNSDVSEYIFIIPKERQRVLQLISQADEGDSKAAFQLGNIYYQGQIMPLDYSRAFYYFKQAADGEHMLASMATGYMLTHGLGTPRNLSLARFYLLKPRDEGYPRAYYLLSLIEAEHLSPQAVIRARQQVQDAALLGDPVAANALGNIYVERKDYALAMRWYEEAIKHGSTGAKENLALITELSTNIKLNNQAELAQSQNKTIQLSGQQQASLQKLKDLEVASKHGDAAASFQLAVAYHKGRGAPMNFTRAVAYYRIAAQQGSVPAEQMLSMIASKATPSRPIDEKWMIELSRTMDTPAVQVERTEPDREFPPLVLDDPLEGLTTLKPNPQNTDTHLIRKTP